MFTIGTTSVRKCSGLTRREMLRVGGLSLAGLTLADWLRSTSASPGAARREAACIFLWLDGGPSHLETFDPKPDTPDTIRGPYGPVPTNVPGIQICELLPRLSRHMDKCVLVRSMSHTTDAHSPVPMLTGFTGETTSYGAVISRMQGYRGNMPPYIHVGSRLGVGGGRLGAPFFPVEIADPTGNRLELPQFSLAANISADRLTQRTALLSSIDQARASAGASDTIERMDQNYQRAINILTSTQV